MSLFKRRRFPVEIILLCVRWYCKYGISYRDLAEMMSERGVSRRSNHDLPLGSTLCPGDREADPTLPGTSLRLLESGRDLRPSGRQAGQYLFRAVDKHGRLIASMLSDRRNADAAYRFLRKAIKAMSDYPPSSITTDKLASYPRAILRLQNEGLSAERCGTPHLEISE